MGVRGLRDRLDHEDFRDPKDHQGETAAKDPQALKGNLVRVSKDLRELRADEEGTAEMD